MVFENLGEEKAKELFEEFKANGINDDDAFSEVYSIDCNMDDDDERKYEELKKELFMRGDDTIVGFLGYSDDITGLSKDAIENLMDETYAQMPDDVLVDFYEKYNII